MCIDFAFNTAEAEFILNKTIKNKIDEIYKKSIELAELNSKLYPKGGSSVQLSDEETQAIAKKITQQLKWLREQRDIIKELFRKEMALK